MKDNDKITANEAPALPPELQAEAEAMIAEIEGEQPTNDTGAGAEGKPDAMPTGDMVAQLLGVTFNHVIAPRRGDHWKINDAEAKALGDAYGAVIDKYWPDFMNGPEIAAVLTSMAVLGPRMMQDAEQSKAKDKAKKPGASDESQTEAGDVPDAA